MLSKSTSVCMSFAQPIDEGTALRQLEVLHAKLSTVGQTSKMKVLALNFQREAANLQILAKKQLEILGVAWTPKIAPEERNRGYFGFR